MPDNIPKAIDGYPVEKKLGEGAAGEVYLVRLPGKQRFAALKLLRNKSDPGEILRFRREFGSIARCRHPGIIAVYNLGEVNGFPYFLMEFIKGTDILAGLRKGLRERARLPDDRMALLFKSAVLTLDALRYLHSQQIIHRDLKPANILLTEDQDIKLLDFGLALKPKTSDSSENFGGTAGYLAPEQILMHRSDPRSDLYAFGVCFYEILCGIHPFGQKDDWQKLIARQLEGSFLTPTSLHPELSEDWDDFFRHLLSQDPLFRYQSAAQVIAELKRLTPPVDVFSVADKSYGSWGLLPVPWIDSSGDLETVIGHLKKSVCAVLYKAPVRSGKSRFLDEIRGSDYVGSKITLRDVHLDNGSSEQCRALYDVVIGSPQKSAGQKRQISQIEEFFNTDITKQKGSPQSRLNHFIQGFEILGKNVSKDSKVLILIDDCEKADELFITVLSELLKGGNGAVQAVLTAASENRLSELKPFVIEWKPFDNNQIKRYCEATLSEAIHSEAFIRQIALISEGKPGVINDLLNGWIADGSFKFVNDSWMLGPPAVQVSTRINDESIQASIGLPLFLRPLIPESERIDREVLRALAVFERECPFRIISGVFTAKEEVILEVLDRLIKAGWIVEDVCADEVLYRYSRDEYRQFIYQSIAPFHLANLHKRLADLVLRKEWSMQDRSEFLAEHYFKGEDPSLALPYAEEAAQLAHSRFSNHRAIFYYDIIQSICRQILEKKSRDWPGPSDMAVRIEKFFPSTLENAYRAASLAKLEEFDTKWLAACREKGQIFSLTGEYGLALEQFQRMYAKSKDLGHLNGEANALRFIGQVLYYQKKFEESEKYFLESLAVREKMQQKSGIADSLNALGAVYQQLNDLDKAVIYFQQALIIKQELGDERGVAFLRNNLGNIFFLKEESQKALSEFSSSFEILSGAEDKLGMAYAAFNMGQAYRQMGKTEDAIVFLEKSLSLRSNMQDLRGAALSLKELGELYLQIGKDALGVQKLLLAADTYDELGCLEEAQVCRATARIP